jgi:hypothetical protein
MCNIRLSENILHHLPNIDDWSRMMQEQQDRSRKFLPAAEQITINTVVSTNVTRTAVKTLSIGNKPNQKKRKKFKTCITQLKTTNAEANIIGKEVVFRHLRVLHTPARGHENVYEHLCRTYALRKLFVHVASLCDFYTLFRITIQK